MTIDELLNISGLEPLPMRAWLSSGENEKSSSAWALHDRWTAPGEQPILCGTRLRLLDLEHDLQCVALVGHAVVPGDGLEILDEEERAFVYLLNPADPWVREAIECWLQRKFITVCSGDDGVLSSGTLEDEAAVLEACQYNEDDEIISDFVTCTLVELWQKGRLESVVKSRLGINRPLFCAIVETPMLCASLRPPLTQEEVDAHEAHQANKFALEGISS